jgi:WD repeat-containing protein 45
MDTNLKCLFNQDATCFSCINKTGFEIYNCDPLAKRFERKNMSQLRMVIMLYKTNIFAIVNNDYPNTLIIWDDFESKALSEIEFKSPITGVKLRKDVFLVITETKTFLYRLVDYELLYSVDTIINKKGIGTISLSQNPISVILGPVPGTIIIYQYATEYKINAHKTNIALTAITNDGAFVGTASEKGTVVRIWNTITGEMIKEFRRGTAAAEITSMSFNHTQDQLRLAVCSSTGTCHIFNITTPIANKRSTLNYVVPTTETFFGFKPFKYFSSEWSEISFKVEPGSICAFSINANTIYVLTIAGNFCKYIYNPVTGTANCLEYTSI